MSTMMLGPKRKEDVVDEVDIPAVFQVVVVIVKKTKTWEFYTFPEGKSSEKQMLRKRWIHAVSRKDVQPTIGHRVCSVHFEGGCKTHMNNVPTITPKRSK